MIFKTFDQTDIVAGRTTRVASGFWPEGYTTTNQENFADDYWSLTDSSTSPSPSYGSSVYDVRRTMYYLNVFPDSTYKANNDPYFSVTYGHFYGNLGSGSFPIETASIQVAPTKAIYSQYQNMLLGTADLDGKFSMKSGSTTVDADDIWVIAFSTYKMKDRVDEGAFEISFGGPLGTVTLIDDSYYTSQAQSSYQLVEGTLDSPTSTPTYGGFGILYPQNGIVILNAAKLAAKIGITTTAGVGTDGGPLAGGAFPYTPGLTDSAIDYTYNHKTLFESIKSCTGKTLKVRKSEYVPARHYFIRVKNRDFNYSNNPTYVYDGTDGIHAKGTIRNTDFIDDPRTYITTVGLYNENNELVVVAKLSRPAIKTFDNELLIKCRVDF